MINRLIWSAILLMGILSQGFGQAREFEIVFDENCRNHLNEPVSKEFDLHKSDKIPFVGISAYVMDPAVENTIYYRIKAGDKWGKWRPFRKMTEGKTEDRVAYEGEPIYGIADFIQFKSSKLISEPFIFRLYFPPTEKKKPLSRSDLSPLKTSAICNCNQPQVCLRNCWCPDGSCPKNPNPDPTTPTHIIIHHSAGFNTSNNFNWVVSYYWDLHVNTNGWSDIGYNWLIDDNGVIYEGRGSGVLGTHFSCMNSNTTGICMIGNFMDTVPSDTALAQLKRLLAWDACDKNIVPDTATLHNSSQLVLNHISSHRDANTSSQGCPKGTVCPGDSLYPMLPAIRAELASFLCLEGVGTEEYNFQEGLDINIYPNPAFDRVNISWNNTYKKLNLEIFTATGQRILKREIQDAFALQNIEFSVGSMATGHYLLKLSSEANYATEKLHIQ